MEDSRSAPRTTSVTPMAGIIHHHRQLIGEHPVGPAQQEIPAVPGEILAVGAHVSIREADNDTRRDPQPQRRRTAAAARPLCRLFLCQIPAGAGVDDLPVLPVRGAGRMELRPGAEARVDQPLGPPAAPERPWYSSVRRLCS